MSRTSYSHWDFNSQKTRGERERDGEREQERDREREG